MKATGLSLCVCKWKLLILKVLFFGFDKASIEDLPCSSIMQGTEHTKIKKKECNLCPEGENSVNR